MGAGDKALLTDMRMLFLGDLNIHTESSSKCNAFKELGILVDSISSECIPHLPGLGKTTGLLARIERRLNPMKDPNNMNGKLVQMMKSGELQQYNFIWSDKAINLQPKVLKSIKASCPNTHLIFASGDNMAVPAFRNKAFLDTIHLFDAVITSKSMNIGQLYELGARFVAYIPKAFDERWLEDLTKPQQSIDASFIGSFEEQRAQSLLALAKSGVKLEIWGNGWEKFPQLQYCSKVHNCPVYGNDLINKIEKTKINLCFLRKLAGDLSTNRTFEIPACGGFMLGERTKEQSDFFAEGREAEYFDNDDEMIEKAQILP